MTELPAHHHPFDDCDGCRRAQEIIKSRVANILSAGKAYLEGNKEILRQYEPFFKKFREEVKEAFFDAKVYPEIWDSIEVINAAYQKLENEKEATLGTARTQRTHLAPRKLLTP